MMADVFISYAREDRARIERLSKALEAEGISVWWDRDIAGGTEFSKETEKQLDEANVILVAWSKAAIDSMWVADEATVGRDKGNLAPILIDAVAPKLGFRQLQTIDLSAWAGGRSEAPFAELVACLRARIGAAAASPPPRRRRRRWPVFAAAAAATLLLASAAAFLLFGRDSSGGGRAERASPAGAIEEASIAVLAFDNMSGDAENEYFSDGVSEELLNDLAQVPGLRVAARTSSFSFKGKTAGVEEIGRALNVRHVLEGSVRRAGDRVRITAQLIDADDGFHLWSKTYDREVADILAVQDEIAGAITRELTGRLLPGRKGESRPSVDPQAYTAYLEGRFLLNKRNPADILRAAEFFKTAIAIDPDFAEAHASLAYGYASLFTIGERRDVRDDAKRETDIALRLDPENSLALLASARVAVGEWKWLEAERTLARVIDAYPNDAEARYAYSLLLLVLGLPEAATAPGRLAAELDPLSAIMRENLGDLYHFQNRRAEARSEYEAALAIDPGHVFALGLLCTTEAALSNFDRAIALVDRLVIADGDNGRWTNFCRVAIALHSGDRDAQRRLADAAPALHRTGVYSISDVAWIYALAGDLDQALVWNDRAYQVRDPNFFYNILDPDLPAQLTADPRWREFLDRPLLREWRAARERIAAAAAGRQ